MCAVGDLFGIFVFVATNCTHEQIQMQTSDTIQLCKEILFCNVPAAPALQSGYMLPVWSYF